MEVDVELARRWAPCVLNCVDNVNALLPKVQERPALGEHEVTELEIRHVRRHLTRGVVLLEPRWQYDQEIGPPDAMLLVALGFASNPATPVPTELRSFVRAAVK